MPALFVLLLMVSLLLLSVPSCRAGKDKVVSTEPTTLLPPPVSAPALVPIPNADDYGDDDNDDSNTNGDDPAAQGPGGQGGGGPNGSGGAGGGGPGGAPTDDAATGGDDKGVVVGSTAAPTSAPVVASGGSSGGGGTSTTTTTYSVSLPVMELDLVLATTASSNAGEGSARRQLQGERRQQVRGLANGTTTTTTTTSNSLDADVVDAALEGFLQTFLARSHRDTLQRVQLSTTVDSYQSTTGVARVTAADGTATFKGEQVQQTDLADTIKT
jgi:hypothetical protein